MEISENDFKQAIILAHMDGQETARVPMKRLAEMYYNRKVMSYNRPLNKVNRPDAFCTTCGFDGLYNQFNFCPDCGRKLK